MAVYNPDNPNYFDPTQNQTIGGGDATATSGSTSTDGSSTSQIPNVTTGGISPGVTQSGVPGFMQNVGQFLTGSNNPLTNSMLIPAIAQAIQQWNNAGTYTQLGQQAAQVANPFGDRSQYVNELSNLEKDPSQIVNTPGYKFALNQAMDATSSKLASQGYLGSTQMQNALATESSGLAQQTYNNTINQLSNLAGAQFNPANAASMLMRGGELSVEAQNGALASLMAPFAAGTNGQGITVNNSNGGSGGGTSGLQSGLSRAVASGAISPQTASQLFHSIMSNPGNISPGDLQLMNSLGIQTPFTNNGMDVAPGSYDSTGFGGYGTASGDPTLQGINFGGNYSPFDYNNIYGGPYNDGTIPSSTDLTGFQDSNLFDDNSGIDLGNLFGG